MLIDFNVALMLFFIFLALNLILIALVIVKKVLSYKIKIKPELKLLEDYVKSSQLFSIKDNKNIDIIKNILIKSGLEKKYIKRLKSLIKFNRIEASVYLGYINNEKIRKILEKYLSKEKNYLVKFYIVNSLCFMKNKSSIPKIIDTLINSPKWYREKCYVLISEFGRSLYEYLLSIIDSEKIELQELIIHFSSIYTDSTLKNYLDKKIDSDDKYISHMAATSLSKIYKMDLNNDKYLKHPDNFIRNIAIKSLYNNNNKDVFMKLIEFLKEPEVQDSTIYSISSILKSSPYYLQIVEELFYNTDNYELKKCLTKILLNKIEYFLIRVNRKDDINFIEKLIEEILKLKKTTQIINFLNKNKNKEIENGILRILKKYININEDLKTQFRLYLNENTLKKLNLEKIEHIKQAKEEKVEKSKIKFLYILIISLFLTTPLIYIIRHLNILLDISFLDHLKLFVIDFNYYLFFYSSSIVLIYIIILFFSYLGVSKQYKYWRIKKLAFLFKKRILPSISIVAPAYCEEATIIESVNSLLNLKYPNYELIVVNDGSPDNTLETLISYFELEKTEMDIEIKINTKPIRGIYTNKTISKLIVVDKENGGKADSLNAGINISTKDYFCGVDSDSLLEDEALLKSISYVLDIENEGVASGGNILPINGCKVNNGMIEKIELPDSNIAKFQTIEYLRAFMTGRIGWSYINCLLIISGAFGVFKKDRVIEIGGYLTSSGKHKKDTVGEDMELVVRLKRHMLEKKVKHTIHYAYNANCWTEIPEDFKILSKQRDRWHRGLIDIISFHRKILFNPFYKEMGLIAFPYFFIFEMAGPFIEYQGYLMVVLSLIFGFFNPTIALLLFTAVILMGIFISLSALFIAEKEISYFTLKDIFKLILFAIIENFGFRQIVNWWRVTGYINSMKKKTKGWGKMVRKGFKK